jgi:hypothetical protein
VAASLIKMGKNFYTGWDPLTSESHPSCTPQPDGTKYTATSSVVRDGWWVDRKHFSIGFMFPS